MRNNQQGDKQFLETTHPHRQLYSAAVSSGIYRPQREFIRSPQSSGKLKRLHSYTSTHITYPYGAAFRHTFELNVTLNLNILRLNRFLLKIMYLNLDPSPDVALPNTVM